MYAQLTLVECISCLAFERCNLINALLALYVSSIRNPPRTCKSNIIWFILANVLHTHAKLNTTSYLCWSNWLSSFHMLVISMFNYFMLLLMHIRMRHSITHSHASSDIVRGTEQDHSCCNVSVQTHVPSSDCSIFQLFHLAASDDVTNW